MKNLLITGASSGLGLNFINQIENEEFNIYVIQRKFEPEKYSTKNINYIFCNLEDYVSIFECYEKIKDIMFDVIIFNAGVFLCDYKITNSNFEKHFSINYFAHYQLYRLLEKNIKTNCKIINVSSLAHKMKDAKIHFDDILLEKRYHKFQAYQQSKLACAMFGMYLSNKYNSIIIHPGVCVTEIGRNIRMFKIFKNLGYLFGYSKVEDAVEVYLYALKNNFKEVVYLGPTGKKEYKGKVGIVKLSEQAQNEQLIKQLINLSEERYLILKSKYEKNHVK